MFQTVSEQFIWCCSLFTGMVGMSLRLVHLSLSVICSGSWCCSVRLRVSNNCFPLTMNQSENGPSFITDKSISSGLPIILFKKTVTVLESEFGCVCTSAVRCVAPLRTVQTVNQERTEKDIRPMTPYDTSTVPKIKVLRWALVKEEQPVSKYAVNTNSHNDDGHLKSRRVLWRVKHRRTSICPPQTSSVIRRTFSRSVCLKLAITSSEVPKYSKEVEISLQIWKYNEKHN